jgi:ABC-type phosphate/phosphonate transport system permease subunit
MNNLINFILRLASMAFIILAITLEITTPEYANPVVFFLWASLVFNFLSGFFNKEENK